MDDKVFIPFDTKCSRKLESRFQALFEPKLIDEICQNGKLRIIAADRILVDIGSSIDFMPIVISGSIKVMTEDIKGNELLLYYLQEGETCAVTLNCCLSESKSAVRAITEQESEILSIPIEKMDYWMQNYKSWRSYILGSFNLRLNEMIESFDNIVFNSLEERLIKYLRDKAQITGDNVLRISHQDIAYDMHSTRVSISRLMRKLESNKVITRQRNKVVILDA
ncbi:Crp/Fnr family transcriptional regulator [Saprospiraceae bacterium]|nr:Crp/Fnr family transcriptional regulator [Saprospiraceae bacterium]